MQTRITPYTDTFYAVIHNSESLNIFKKRYSKFLRPTEKHIFKCHNPRGTKLLAILQHGLNRHIEHKLKFILKIRLWNYFNTSIHFIKSKIWFFLHFRLMKVSIFPAVSDTWNPLIQWLQNLWKSKKDYCINTVRFERKFGKPGL